MNDEQALLAAILANPDDDTVRLAFADWLQENGKSDRAAFVRWQIANVGRPGTGIRSTGTPGNPVRAASFAENSWPFDLAAASLIGTHPVGYVQVTNGSAAVQWRRGFVEAFACSGTSFGPLIPHLKANPVRELILRGPVANHVLEKAFGLKSFAELGEPQWGAYRNVTCRELFEWHFNGHIAGRTDWDKVGEQLRGTLSLRLFPNLKRVVVTPRFWLNPRVPIFENGSP